MNDIGRDNIFRFLGWEEWAALVIRCGPFLKSRRAERTGRPHSKFALRAQPKRIICQPVTAPRFIQPCSPTSASKPPTGERWTHEVKWDGYRFQVLKVGREVRLFSRNGVDRTERLPAIAAAFARLPARVAQIDGELCLCDADSRPDFRALMRAATTPGR